MITATIFTNFLLKWQLLLRRFSHWPAAALLLVAATMKLYQLAILSFADSQIIISPWISFGIILAESSIGFWLISEWHNRLARGISIVIFLLFITINFVAIRHGDLNCGCFGGIPVSPSNTLIVDVVSLVGLCFWRPVRTHNRVTSLFAAGIMTLIGISVVTYLSFETVSLNEIGQTVDDGKLIVVRSESWLHKTFPLQNLISEGEFLKSGKWQIILYHQGCPVCNSVIYDLSKQRSSRLAFVEIPPYKSPSRPNSKNHIWLKLSDKYKWFVVAPVVLTLEDGVVLKTDAAGKKY